MYGRLRNLRVKQEISTGLYFHDNTFIDYFFFTCFQLVCS